MAENERPLSDFISSVEQVEVVEDTPPTEGSVKPVGKKSKAFPIIVGILLLFIIGMGGYYVYKQYYGEEEVDVFVNEESTDIDLNEEDIEVPQESDTDSALIDTDGDNSFKFLDIKEGDFDEESLTCNGVCTVDIEVTYVEGSSESKFVLRSIEFNHAIQSINKIKYDFSDSGLTAYLLRYGSGNESGTYVVNEQGDISEEFCSSDASLNEVLWDNGHLVYEDCGVVGWYSELASGISIVNLENGQRTQIAIPEAGSDTQPQVHYRIEGVSYVNKVLDIRECKYSGTTEECEDSEIDLSAIQVLN